MLFSFGGTIIRSTQDLILVLYSAASHKGAWGTIYDARYWTDSLHTGKCLTLVLSLWHNAANFKQTCCVNEECHQLDQQIISHFQNKIVENNLNSKTVYKNILKDNLKRKIDISINKPSLSCLM